MAGTKQTSAVDDSHDSSEGKPMVNKNKDNDPKESESQDTISPKMVNILFLTAGFLIGWLIVLIILQSHGYSDDSTCPVAYSDCIRLKVVWKSPPSLNESNTTLPSIP